ncbi:guanine deaminase [Gonapodya prolifera JEL478]|uniref:Guanine deaminase n=1 Tax=Gonapodya prolifera (strain JEL478) TaxID=1344416 RepID=A0A139ARY7_GONPJ|nr:guanine deaminase [Gonapodya prolifera JEL478]|eukprot:KXS19516.1 guanine deaminase [Gonapodya prolifera JEL478]
MTTPIARSRGDSSGGLFIKNALVLVTNDASRREIRNGAVIINGNVVEKVGSTAELESHVNPKFRIIDLENKAVLLPGFISIHHHMLESLTRVYGTKDGIQTLPWLERLVPLWSEVTGRDLYVATKVCLAELMLSGSTTMLDHCVGYWNDMKPDLQVQAAREMRVRFHVTRGGNDVRDGSDGDALCEDTQDILADARRVVATFHDPHKYAMSRVALGTVAVSLASPALHRGFASIASSNPGVSVTTHLYEGGDEFELSMDEAGISPLERLLSDDLGGPPAVTPYILSHCVHTPPTEISLLAQHKLAVAHCPSSNAILGAGIAPVRKFLQAGVTVGLGTDGSSSNDGNNLLGEIRQAMLFQRLGAAMDAGLGNSGDITFTARQALELATLGSAAALGRDDIGQVSPGYAADLVAFRVDGLQHAGGSVWDPVASLVVCSPVPCWLNVIDGVVCIQDGSFTTEVDVDVTTLVQEHNTIAAEIQNKVKAKGAYRP